MFSKLRNEISAHKVRYSVISAVLVLAVVLFALFGVSYKTLYSLVTHGGSGFGNAIKDTPKWTSAKVSPLTLSVYDDEVKTALSKVIEWVKKIASSPDGAM